MTSNSDQIQDYAPVLSERSFDPPPDNRTYGLCGNECDSIEQYRAEFWQHMSEYE